MKEKENKKYNSRFKKNDARHYVIYSQLYSFGIDSHTAYDQAENILEALRTQKLL